MITDRDNPEELRAFIAPLLEKLQLNKGGKEELIYALINIYSGKQEGWETLGHYCCFNKKNAQVIFKCLLQLIDWGKGRNIREEIKGVKMYSVITNRIGKRN